jgi:hypothetical protein
VARVIDPAIVTTVQVNVAVELAASADPPQLVALAAPQAVADLICSAQLAERTRTWRPTNTPI